MCCLGWLALTPLKLVLAVLKQVFAVLNQVCKVLEGHLPVLQVALKTRLPVQRVGLALPEAMFVVLGEWHNKR
tara:strand:- start:242 stop:460 length:219 start_codon:yes stop_codon:yes gene_type:complete